MSSLVKVNIKIISLLAILLLTLISKGQEEEVLFSEATEESNGSVHKKGFKQEEYDRLKKEVELVEEINEKKLKADSSEFGRGYGVEYGKDYYVDRYDTINGDLVLRENEKSGKYFEGDGVRKDSRNRDRSGLTEREQKTKRNGNQGRRFDKGKTEEPKPKKDPVKIKSKQQSSGGFTTFLLILLLAGALGAVAYFVFINSPMEGKSKTVNLGLDGDIDPTQIQLSELELKIIEATNKNDFRMATRLYFIWVMKDLSEGNHIVWRKKKTNYHYLSELSSKPFSNQFEKAVSVYEYVWYGKYELSAEEFSIVKKDFVELIKKINQKG